jgi:hypothetical protein
MKFVLSKAGNYMNLNFKVDVDKSHKISVHLPQCFVHVTGMGEGGGGDMGAGSGHTIRI